MKSENVGARILSIITESLYDKPVVVFREYVQNSVDSFQKAEKKKRVIAFIYSDVAEKRRFILS